MAIMQVSMASFKLRCILLPLMTSVALSFIGRIRIHVTSRINVVNTKLMPRKVASYNPTCCLSKETALSY